MKRNDFLHGFSQRITMLLQQANLGSDNSKAKVKVSRLAEVAGCSHQMARRYVLGEALPEIDVTYKIAKWLNVSPGWLLFGEEIQVPDNIEKKQITCIETDILHYIITKSLSLSTLAKEPEELALFILAIIQDVIHVRAEKKEVFKIIDISINSAMHFNKIGKNIDTYRD